MQRGFFEHNCLTKDGCIILMGLDFESTEIKFGKSVKIFLSKAGVLPCFNLFRLTEQFGPKKISAEQN